MKKIIQVACETVKNQPYAENRKNVEIAFFEFFENLGGKKLAEKFEKAIRDKQEKEAALKAVKKILC